MTASASTAHVRLLHGERGLEYTLEGVDYLSLYGSEPSAIERVFAIYANVIEVDEDALVLTPSTPRNVRPTISEAIAIGTLSSARLTSNGNSNFTSRLRSLGRTPPYRPR